MAQPPTYERAEDFTQRDGDDTNHPAINAELDRVSTSINRTRENLALIQRDDGGLRPGIVDRESLSGGAFEAVLGRVNDASLTADAAANSAIHYAGQVQTSSIAASASAAEAAGYSDTSAQKAAEAAASATAAANSASAAAGSASTANTKAGEALASATAASNSAATATAQAGNAAASATAASNSATNAASSASASASSAAQAASSKTAAANSATAASNSATTATAQAGNAATSATAAANSAADAAASASAAEAAAQAASNALESTASNIKMDGVQSAGALSTAARGDHRHPTDTSRAPINSPNLTGTPTAPTAPAGTNTTQIATTAFAKAEAASAAADIAGMVSDIAGMVSNMLYKTDPTPCLVKTGGGTLAVKAGTSVYLSSGVVSFASQTAVTMPTLTAGEDYSVWVLPNGTAQAVADPFSAPASAPASGALKIGGFHYGLVAPGTTPASGSFATSGFSNTGGNMVWTQADVDRIAGINEFTIWDLSFRSAGEQHGMVLDPQMRVWWGIYLCSTVHIANGISRYNTDVASGTVLPRIPLVFGGNGTTTYGRLSLYEAVEIAASHNCRLPSYEEFMSAAFGVTEGQSLGGASSTIPATGRQAGYTSRIGMEQATGHHWIIGAPFVSSGSSGRASAGRGFLFASTGLPAFGGSRGVSGAESGSRSSQQSSNATLSAWGLGLRAVCGHLNL